MNRNEKYLVEQVKIEIPFHVCCHCRNKCYNNEQCRTIQRLNFSDTKWLKLIKQAKKQLPADHTLSDVEERILINRKIIER